MKKKTKNRTHPFVQHRAWQLTYTSYMATSTLNVAMNPCTQHIILNTCWNQFYFNLQNIEFTWLHPFVQALHTEGTIAISITQITNSSPANRSPKQHWALHFQALHIEGAARALKQAALKQATQLWAWPGSLRHGVVAGEVDPGRGRRGGGGSRGPARSSLVMDRGVGVQLKERRVAVAQRGAACERSAW